MQGMPAVVVGVVFWGGDPLAVFCDRVGVGSESCFGGARICVGVGCAASCYM